MTAQIDQARHDYAAFRDIARACFPQSADRQTLSLTGDMPDDTGRFTTTATASYTAAGNAPYSTKLSKRNYAKERLDSLLADLKTLSAAAADRIGAIGTATSLTAARDEAYQELKTFMKEWKGIARGALRGNTVALGKLGL